MECTSHPTVTATEQCTGCGQFFCADCLVSVQGARYCANCKSKAVPIPPSAAIPPPPVMSGQAGYQQTTMPTVPCKEAGEALTLSIIGLFCFGIILEPLALSKALKAKKMMALNPNLEGSGKAQAALIISSIGLGLWVLGIIIRLASIAAGLN